LWLQIHQTVTSGGKVLVPVFAVGRAQELLMLLDEHWQRTQLEVGRGAITYRAQTSSLMSNHVQVLLP
jgi:Cft2 family RNA processing exonuclease